MGTKSKSTKGYLLTQGSVVKLGRMKYKVREIKTWNDLGKPAEKSSDPADGETPDTSGEYTAESVAEEYEEFTQKICRICFCEQTDASDPLISPCSCAGSMEHIHFECLKQWISLRMNPSQTSNVV
jgi:hypothetical protein